MSLVWAMSGFEDLIAWRVAKQLAEEVEVLTRSPSFHGDSPLGLQLRKAAVSVGSNIAEGHGRGRRAEFASFLRIARGSAVEVQSQLGVALANGRVSFQRYQSARGLADRAVALITKLHAAVASQTERD